MTNRIKPLDGLRGIFAATVMIGHFSLFANHFQADAFKNVMLCVQFFFILSGFALAYGFEEKFRNASVRIGSFAWQRLTRLYPIHILSMLAAGLFIPPLMGTLSATKNLAWGTLLNLLLLQCVGLTDNWSWNIPSWSISTEFWVGLLVLPFAFRFIKTTVAILLSATGYTAIFLVVGSIRNQYAFVAPGLTLGVLSTTSGLLLGVALYRIGKTKNFNLNFGTSARSLAGLSELALLCAILYIASIGRHGGIEIFSIVAMPFLILSSSTSHSFFANILSSKPFAWLGKISYSLYLIHLPILGAMTLCGLEKIENIPFRFALFAIVAAVVSTLVYRFIERPIYDRFRYAVSPSRNFAPTT